MRFSIIVPVYGTEQYLGDCVASLLDQTFADYEIILVDDCSPDGCPALCDSYTDPRIRVIHKAENQGLGFARNTGIAAAGGDYVLFVDSDDRVSPQLLETCQRHLTPQTDILVYGLELQYEDAQGAITWRESKEPAETSAVSPEERARLFADLSRGGLFPYACNKAYRRGFLQGDCLPFEQTKLIEDFLFNIHAFGVAGRIDAIAPALYYYRKPVHETLASQFNPEFFHLALRKYDLEQQFLRQCGCQDPALWNLVHENMVKHIISAAVRNRSPKAGYTPRQRRQRIAEMVTDPAVEALLRDYTPRNRVYRIICAWMGRKRVTLLGLLAWMVQLMQTKMKPLYQKVLGR